MSAINLVNHIIPIPSRKGKKTFPGRWETNLIFRQVVIALVENQEFTICFQSASRSKRAALPSAPIVCEHKVGSALPFPVLVPVVKEDIEFISCNPACLGCTGFWRAADVGNIYVDSQGTFGRKRERAALQRMQ